MQIKTMCVLLNGPPGIGKDTIADLMVELSKNLVKDSFHKKEYKTGLRRATAQRYNAIQSTADALFAHREEKDLPSVIFDGKTPREALIETDTYLKKKYGKTMVGQWAAEDVRDSIRFIGQNFFVFSDSGFLQEAQNVAAEVDYLIVVQLHHKDFNFDNDSRDYIEMKGVNSETIKYHRQDDAAEHDVLNILDLISDAVWEKVR